MSQKCAWISIKKLTYISREYYVLFQFLKLHFFLSIDTLLIDYQFTFSLSQEDDRYYTAINFVATPDEVRFSKSFCFILNLCGSFSWSLWRSTALTVGSRVENTGWCLAVQERNVRIYILVPFHLKGRLLNLSASDTQTDIPGLPIRSPLKKRKDTVKGFLPIRVKWQSPDLLSQNGPEA